MFSVPLPPGKATTRSGFHSNIFALRFGPAAPPILLPVGLTDVAVDLWLPSGPFSRERIHARCAALHKGCEAQFGVQTVKLVPDLSRASEVPPAADNDVSLPDYRGSIVMQTLRPT
jgi:hypothetical protein